MPPVNIHPTVRFALYLFSAIGTVAVSYLVAKDYIGDAETAAWGGLVALVNVLAASNVSQPEDEEGATDGVTVLIVVALVLLCLVLLGVIPR